MLNMIEEESKSKDELINELINELNLLKEANGLALSLMTPDQREKYDKVQYIFDLIIYNNRSGTIKANEDTAGLARRSSETASGAKA